MENIKNKPQIIEVIPAIRMLLTDVFPITIRYSESSSFPGIFGEKDLIADLRPLYIQSYENTDQLIEEFKITLEKYKKSYNELPGIILIDNFGILCSGNSAAETGYLMEKINSKLQHKNMSRTKPVDKNKKGRVHSKIFIVTGGAQGMGSGIVEHLFNEGANVVIADINEENGKKLEYKLNSLNLTNNVLFVNTDVTNPESLENLIIRTVTSFGGLDVFISNAGILRAGSLDDMDTKVFEMMTKVNYTGYYLCAKYASVVLKIQNKYKQGYFTDIIQINSKSGLKGSNKNFAYAGGKFGGIGLTQSFALELIQYNIKVNSICPGNYFEGPLWTDPVNGLFVQYLNTGKVPGAKTVEDVKKFYENQIPARRGCMIADVMKAIFYAIEQEYETGQAIPVTGGQQMLH